MMAAFGKEDEEDENNESCYDDVQSRSLDRSRES